MSTHQCPKCQLIFGLKPVLEYHLRVDHPEAHFDYPESSPADQDWPMKSEPKRYSWRPTYPARRVP